MASKPGQIFTRQAAEPPVVARNINQGLPLLEALDRMGFGRGTSVQWLPGGIPLVRGLPSALAVAKAKSPTGGIAAKNSSTDEPGKEKCKLYLWDGKAEKLGEATVDEVDVYNSQAVAVPGSTDLWIVALDRTQGGDGDWFVLNALSTGIQKAKAPTGGIAAKSGSTPGSATCTLYKWDGTSETLDTATVTVKNSYSSAVGANKDIWIVSRPRSTGSTSDWFVLTEACT